MIRLQEQEAENEDSGPDVNFEHILGVVVSCYVIVLPLIIQCGIVKYLKDKRLGYTACTPVDVRKSNQSI